jgi:hypothetical protein
MVQGSLLIIVFNLLNKLPCNIDDNHVNRLSLPVCNMVVIVKVS